MCCLRHPDNSGGVSRIFLMRGGLRSRDHQPRTVRFGNYRQRLYHEMVLLGFHEPTRRQDHGLYRYT